MLRRKNARVLRRPSHLNPAIERGDAPVEDSDRIRRDDSQFGDEGPTSDVVDGADYDAESTAQVRKDKGKGKAVDIPDHEALDPFNGIGSGAQDDSILWIQFREDKAKNRVESAADTGGLAGLVHQNIGLDNGNDKQSGTSLQPAKNHSKTRSPHNRPANEAPGLANAQLTNDALPITGAQTTNEAIALTNALIHNGAPMPESNIFAQLTTTDQQLLEALDVAVPFILRHCGNNKRLSVEYTNRWAPIAKQRPSDVRGVLFDAWGVIEYIVRDGHVRNAVGVSGKGRDMSSHRRPVYNVKAERKLKAGVYADPVMKS